MERALISAWRKEGIPEFGRFLADRGVEVLSTGGTARCLREAGVEVRDVADVTGFPEMMDGRVKTLHPRVHGGLLFRRDLDSHRAAAAAHDIPRIDLLVVDLYPFEATLNKAEATRADCVEMIDIGGPAMIRAASKNHDAVLVVTDPADLPRVQEAIAAGDGVVPRELLREMAAKAFRRTAAYDAIIADYLTEETFPERLVLPLELKAVTRYGENPHQAGAVYVMPETGEATVARSTQLSGKELSYNNYLDASGAWDCVRAHEGPAVAIIKHRNPCGAAIDEDVVTAFEMACEGDPLSAFGGILAVNRPITLDLAKRIADPKKFLEVILAPSFDDDAVAAIQDGAKWGKNVRLLALGAGGRATDVLEARAIGGGVLVQQRDEASPLDLKCATTREPDDREIEDLRFAWDVVRNVTSNAIVFIKDRRLVGCGAGQMSRVDSVEIAAKKAGDRSSGAVMASDAFFPFADGVEAAAKAGVTAVIQPGGSRRDEDVIAACNAAGVAMLLTGTRHFRH
ncbi:MAG: bifunctional phosphoribosylaminoimidazolecarboxamide formyltransferase/inosine monophosphate cyclohydrolase [Planctomycetes bacterium]|nr:bifunctional phosphoribosylaminoimidazolecarboxamide formyltransferase/inosine monophosphate cyclohydrolase [Planctomycetota bacterium]